MQHILVYADCGVSSSSFAQTVASLENEVDLTQYSIQACDADRLLRTDWEESTALLVIPGGRDLPYHQKLFPFGTRRIYNYVAGGGSYLGLCAGAYFGAREIIFEKGGELEICGGRDLAFFPGRAIGPAYGNGKFRYDSDTGTEAAAIVWKIGERQVSCRAFFNGGCLFETPLIFPHIQIIGTYSDLPDTPAAAIYCEVEKGRAILSGVHIEYAVHNCRDISSIGDGITALLLESEELRRYCFRSLLFQLIAN